MSLKMTRRDLASILGSAASVAVVCAQNPPATPSEDLNAAAKDQLRQNADAMAKIELSMSTEPAFQFKA
jgi:hypothetical protein